MKKTPLIPLACALLLPILHGNAAPPVAVERDPRLHADGPGWRLDKATISDASLLRILFVGDSILQGYMGDVLRLLKGKANIDFWVTPLWQSENFNRILGDVLAEGPYDVIHMNIGLHGWPEGRIKPGTYEPLTQAFVDVIRQKSPRSVFIWANSTPTFQKDNLEEFNSTINPVILEHNRMAASVMQKNRIPINDFYSALLEKRNLVRNDGVHWNPPAMRLLAEIAVNSILRETAPPASTSPTSR